MFGHFIKILVIFNFIIQFKLIILLIILFIQRSLWVYKYFRKYSFNINLFFYIYNCKLEEGMTYDLL